MAEPDELPFLSTIASVDALLTEFSHAAAPAPVWDPQTAGIRAQVRLQLLTVDERRELAAMLERVLKILRLTLDEHRYWTARTGRPAAPAVVAGAPLLRPDVWAPHIGLDEVRAVASLRALWRQLDTPGRALLAYSLEHLPEAGFIVARGPDGAVRITLGPG